MTAAEFLRWWRGQLLDLMPAALRASWPDSKSALVLRIDGSTVELDSPGSGHPARFELPEGGGARPEAAEAFLARLHGRPQRISLVLAPNEYLMRRLTLPRAAQANLPEAVGYQLPQLTPFRASQLIYACGETADSPPDGPVSVWLIAVPRQRIARALELIGQAPPEGYLPLRQPPAAGEAVEFGWRLPESSSFGRRRLRLASLGLAVLALGVLGLHLYHQRQAQARLDAILEGLRERALEVGALRDRLAAAESRAGSLTALKQAAQSPLMLLEELSEELDDQTWLQGLDLRDGRLTLRGISASPATLIETLEASRALRDVRFDAAITRDGRSQGDRFNISAQLEPPAAEGGS